MYPPPTIPERVTQHNRGYGYATSGVTGTMAAALAANSLVFALYCAQQVVVPPAQVSSQISLWIDRLRLAFTTITAFTTPITAPRSLAVYRGIAGGGHVLPTVGTALGIVKKDTNAPTSVASAIIAGTVGFTTGTVTREANPIMTLDLVAVGGAGARQEMIYELAAPQNAPQAINADELLLISNPTAMDAGGTWQLSVDECHWIEAVRNA